MHSIPKESETWVLPCGLASGMVAGVVLYGVALYSVAPQDDPSTENEAELASLSSTPFSAFCFLLRLECCFMDDLMSAETRMLVGELLD